MARKVIAIGNPLMGDDGIGLRVTEFLREKLEEDLGWAVIIGETDVDYCIGQIETGDEVCIIDSTFFGQSPGTISVRSLDQLALHGRTDFSLHQLNLLHLIQLEGIEVSGSLIGIEVQDLGFSLELSAPLKASFEEICTQVYQILEQIK